MDKRSREIINKIKYINKNIALSDNLELDQYCELLNKSIVLNKLVEELVQLNIDVVKSSELEGVSTDYIVNMLVSAYCINNNISSDLDEIEELTDFENVVYNKKEGLTKREKEREEMAEIMAFRNPECWYRSYLAMCPKPIVDLDEQKKIFEKIYAGDMDAKKYFTEANLRLVYSVAKKYEKKRLCCNENNGYYSRRKYRFN